MSPCAPSQRQLDLARWESAAELAEHVRTTDEPVVQLDAEYVDQWATTTVEGVVVALALDRADQRPQVARTGEDAPAVIGLNDGLFGIDLNHRRLVFEFRFGTPFYGFIDVETGGLTALFETGLVSLAADGTERWRRDKDFRKFGASDPDLVHRVRPPRPEERVDQPDQPNESGS